MGANLLDLAITAAGFSLGGTLRAAAREAGKAGMAFPALERFGMGLSVGGATTAARLVQRFETPAPQQQC